MKCYRPGGCGPSDYKACSECSWNKKPDPVEEAGGCRCKSCRFLKEWYCAFHHRPTREGGFCSEGKRK